MAKLKSGTRIYGTATSDTSVVVGVSSNVILSSSGIQISSSGIITATSGAVTTGSLYIQSQTFAVDSGNVNGALALNAGYNYFRYTATGNYTISFTGLTTNRVWLGTLELTNGGYYTASWNSAIKWSGGVSPTLTSSGTDVIQFYSSDGGLNIRGILSISDSQ